MLALLALSVPALGQNPLPVNVGDFHIAGVPDDWSHHHVAFPDPGTEEDAIQNGTYEQWSKIVHEPRYVIQQLKKGLSVRGDASQDVNLRNAERAWLVRFQQEQGAKKTQSKLDKDWSEDLGSGATVGAGNFPAKFSFYTDPGDAGCSDYVVFNTGLAGSATQPTIIAYNNLYTGCGTVPSVYFKYNTAFNADSATPNSNLIQTSVVFTGGEAVTSPDLAFIQSTATGAASLVLLKFPAAANATLVQLNTAGTTNVTPAGFSACTAPCMTVIPFNDSFADTNSSPYYDYANDALYVGDTGSASSAPHLHKFIHIFTNTPTLAPAECLSTATAGCSTTTAFPVALGTSHNTVATGPVFDFVSGKVFIGTSGGQAIVVSSTTGVATAATAVASGAGFVDAPLVDSAPTTPVAYYFGRPSGGTEDVWQYSNTATLNATLPLSQGTFDDNYYAGAFDNIHYAVSGGTAGHLYVCGGGQTATPFSALYAITLPFTSGSTVTTIGTLANAAGTCSPVTEFLGSKANTTITAGIAGTGTPTSVPVASVTGTAQNDYIQIDSEIMQITSTTGTTPLTVTRGQLGTAEVLHAAGAAVQDIQDWIFLSVTAGGNATGCTGACLYNYNVTTNTLPTNATTGIAATGGSSGIIIDNSSTTTGYSQIYYSTLANQTCTTSGGSGGCAVQTSQSAP